MLMIRRNCTSEVIIFNNNDDVYLKSDLTITDSVLDFWVYHAEKALGSLLVQAHQEQCLQESSRDDSPQEAGLLEVGILGRAQNERDGEAVGSSLRPAHQEGSLRSGH
jgi:hypothetical protein